VFRALIIMTNLISQSALVVVLVVLGNQCDHSSETTPILDKKSLELILDKLQKYTTEIPFLSLLCVIA
jgi:bromodomain-containing protein 7/9